MLRITFLFPAFILIGLWFSGSAFAQADPVDPEPTALADPSPRAPASITKRGVITRSVFLPGLGQLHRGQKNKGLGLMASALGTFFLARNNESGRKSAIADKELYDRQYAEALTQSEMDVAYGLAQDALAKAKDKAGARDRWFMIMKIVWVANIVDASLGWSVSEKNMDLGLSRAPDGQAAVCFTLSR